MQNMRLFNVFNNTFINLGTNPVDNESDSSLHGVMPPVQEPKSLDAANVEESLVDAMG